MRILGIDPGLERVGFGVVNRDGSRLTAIEYGLIETPRIDISDRLRMVHEGVTDLIDRFEPDAMAMERLMFSVNRKTAMDVARALGVICLAAAQRGLVCQEYTPPEIKLTVVGQGAAEKKQVQFMVTRLLSLDSVPKPDDVADALAIAICHALKSRVSIARL